MWYVVRSLYYGHIILDSLCINKIIKIMQQKLNKLQQKL
jgi:hypothetical protein